MSKHYELGKEGEQLAINYLEKNGYKILEKNWRYQKAEVDIIAKKSSCCGLYRSKNKNLRLFWKSTRFCFTKKDKIIDTCNE